MTVVTPVTPDDCFFHMSTKRRPTVLIWKRVSSAVIAVTLVTPPYEIKAAYDAAMRKWYAAMAVTDTSCATTRTPTAWEYHKSEHQQDAPRRRACCRPDGF
jgi:hypothetical protein